MRCLRNHVFVVILVSDRVSVVVLDSALKPHNRLVYPIIVTRRISLGLLATHRSLDQALIALIHQRHNRLGSSHASVTALSTMCR
jgi:hypothetical protein